MKTVLAKLSAAAVALVAARAALGCEPAEAARPGVRVTVAAAVPVPVPLPTPMPVLRVHDERWSRPGDDRWDRRDDSRWERERRERWHREAWRAGEQARLRAEYARLDDARADFYARPHRGWEVRRFEAWYAGARADLDLRWDRLRWVAAR